MSKHSRSFHRLAPLYDGLMRVAFLGNIERAQRALIPHLPPHSRLALVGGGTGQILPALLSHLQHGHVHYIECAPGMMQRARQHAEGHSNISFYLQEAENVLPALSVDAVWLPFVIDLYSPEEARQFMQLIRRCLPAGGLLLLTDYCCLNSLHQTMLRCMYFVCRLLLPLPGSYVWHYFECLEWQPVQILQQYDFFGSFIRSVVARLP
ncbi:class I SAM-dependent methyltransferase [Thermonema rossianum]|uniref:class I SAM-dependent methyltransferase n=1 Tax=Thermonema rossianum TaxID=55505 RepID=UPI0005714B10|nr:class I SAM-dependent methyltransferase [Thermonema rossianum]